MLVVVTWLWGTKYSDEDVRKLHSGLSRHLKQQHRFFVAKPLANDQYLTDIKGCFCRLRMFDPEWQKLMQMAEDDKLVCIDLDVVITGPLDHLFNRPETFMILQGANTLNPCPFNGSLMMLRAGWHADVWSDFSIQKVQSVPFHEFPDDQGWIHHKLPRAAGWQAGARSGVYAFQKPGWPKGVDLPKDACMVVFPGWRSPQTFKHIKWVQQHWQ